MASETDTKNVESKVEEKNNNIVEDDATNIKIVKPGQARKMKLYLIDPERFVIEWATPKKIGSPLPLYYNIVINNKPFEKVVTQYKLFPNSTESKESKKSKQENDKRPHIFRLIVYNCDIDELYKVGIDTFNDKIKGKQTSLYSIKTIIKPSVITNLKMNDGIISWKPPIYKSFGNLNYELIDANDTEEITILSTQNCQININQYYKDKQIQDLDELRWRIRIKEPKTSNCSFSPVIGYS